MQFDDLIKELRRHWFVAAVAMLLVCALGALAAFLPEERYASSVTVLVTPNLNEMNAGAVQVVESVLPAIETRMNSQSFSGGALERIPEYRASDVSLTAFGDGERGVLIITANSPDPLAAAAWVDAWAEHLVENPPPTDLVNIERLDRAIPASSPYTPVRPPILVGSFILGLIAAVFAPLGAAWLQRRREGPRSLIERTGVTVLGEIPAVGKRDAPGSTSVEATVGFGPPEVVEAFQSLRTNLEIMLLSAGGGPIAVTSTRAGEGKSTVTAHLGWALASVGHHVSVIDADLRRPTIHSLFDAPLEPGLSDAARIPATRLLRKVGQPRLSVVPAGAPDRHPAEVMRDSLPLLVEQVAGADRLVLIDCPPLAGVAESSMIVTMARRVVLVIDARTDQGEVERSLTRLRELGAEVLGVVVNRSRRKRDSKVNYFFDPNRIADRSTSDEARPAQPVPRPPAPRPAAAERDWAPGANPPAPAPGAGRNDRALRAGPPVRPAGPSPQPRPTGPTNGHAPDRRPAVPGAAPGATANGNGHATGRDAWAERRPGAERPAPGLDRSVAAPDGRPRERAVPDHDASKRNRRDWQYADHHEAVAPAPTRPARRRPEPVDPAAGRDDEVAVTRENQVARPRRRL